MQQKAIACTFPFLITRLAPQLNKPPRTGAAGPCKAAHQARVKEHPWCIANPSVAHLPVLPFCTCHHDVALLGFRHSRNTHLLFPLHCEPLKMNSGGPTDRREQTC